MVCKYYIYYFNPTTYHTASNNLDMSINFYKNYFYLFKRLYLKQIDCSIHLFSVSWFTLQITTVVGTGPSQAKTRGQELHQDFPWEKFRDLSTWAVFCSFPRCISIEPAGD